MDGKLQDYADVVGRELIDELYALAERVHHLHLQNINSTAVGGGVAEILTRLVPLLRELGVPASWDIVKGDQAFFNVTKAFHNALHGRRTEITPEMLEVFRATTEMNCRETPITGDVVMVHDPQPIGLISQKPEVGKGWIWRCHIDISTPQADVWNFLKPYVEQYDASLFSMPDFAQELPIPQYMVPPSIDPLSDKNKDLPASEIERVLQKYGVDPARPVLTQISRFDRLKDPLGVIASYRMVKRRYNCQLILAGGAASDDPEGLEVLKEVQEQAAEDPDIHVLLLPPFSDLEINALVRGSYVSLQTALAHYGLIPDVTPVTTSVSAGRPGRWETPLGLYDFRHVKAAWLHGYLRLDVGNGQTAFVATPEKALLDLVYLQPGGDAPAYLEALRLQALDRLDPARLARLAEASGSPKLQRAAQSIAVLAQAEASEYETL